jgi:hypothetical protein
MSKIIRKLAGEVYLHIKKWFYVRRPEGVRNERKRKEPRVGLSAAVIYIEKSGRY